LAPVAPPRPTPPAAPAPAARPAPPAVARAVPESGLPAPPAAKPSESAEAKDRAPLPSAPATPSESPFAGRTFSLLRPQLDVPPLPRLPGGGGTRPEGEGAGDAGREREGQAAIPLNSPPDPKYAEYFLKVKKAIEDHWTYPRAAADKGQSGQLMLEFVVHKDGNVLVELVHTSGVEILDRYAVNAVKLAAPFPPIPGPMGMDSIRISASFTYILDRGFRIFGLR
ncbi:MAG: TonB family protein, partial [Candidatus Rokubacteria bacterium]|nr:TonB family protein [Candidatus Rokubacteria bacterium]